jgi:hypothetical protein
MIVDIFALLICGGKKCTEVQATGRSPLENVNTKLP